MNLVVVDFECFFDRDYSLKKLTTEAYLRDSRFEVLGVSIKVGSAPAVWYQGPAIRRAIDAIDWSQSAVLCHHSAFDGAILAWHYGKRPKFWFDSMSMARPYHGQTIGVSLKALANHYQLGEKGDVLKNMMGKHACDLTPHDWMELSAYCIQDNKLTYKLFHWLIPGFPQSELTIIDLTIRMFTEPVLELDTALLTEHLRDVRDKKERLLSNIAASKEDIMSNPKFAEALKGLGVDPPTKISARTGKETFAFAKTDPGLLALREHPDLLVQALVAARLGVKTTIEETRTEAFIEVSKRGTLPVLLNYWGTESSRFAGAGGLNLQNLPARDSASRLKQSICAPIGQLVLDADSSQIEARVLAYIAEQEDLLETFRDKTRDPYGEFATDIYGRKITRADKSERFAGKTCLAEGTLVLTDCGLKPIETIELTDRLWDGDSWVCHQGLISNGTKKTSELCGIWLTPDHHVWSGNSWQEASSLLQTESTRSQALGFAAANLPSQDIWQTSTEDFQPSLLSVNAQIMNTQSLITTSKDFVQQDVMSVQKKQQDKNDIGFTQQLCQMTPTELDCLVGCALPLLDATHQQIGFINPMGGEVLQSAKNGVVITEPFFDIFKQSPAGITPNSIWTEKTITETMNLGILDLLLDNKMLTIDAPLTKCKTEYESLRSVYDIANTGPKHRFFVYTPQGFLCVSNCILQLGYQSGAAKFRTTLAIGAGGMKLIVDEQEAARIVKLYRTRNHKIASFWNVCAYAPKQMAVGNSGVISERCNIRYEGNKIFLPNGLYIQYPDLRFEDGQFTYKTRKGRTKIYGGKITAHICQGIMVCIIKEQMVKIAQQYAVKLQVHDSLVTCIPKEEAEEARAFFESVMSTPPTWAPGLPVACEVKIGLNYGSTVQ